MVASETVSAASGTSASTASWRQSSISRRTSPRRRWAGLVVTSVIIRSGSDARPQLRSLSNQEVVATGIGDAP